MATFTYDYEPGDEVFVVVESDPSFIIEQSKVLQVELLSNIDTEDNIESSYTYLVLDNKNERTRRVDPSLVFATNAEALDYVRTQLTL